MDPVSNPFVPGAGTAPSEPVGREALLDQIRIALARAQTIAESMGYLVWPPPMWGCAATR